MINIICAVDNKEIEKYLKAHTQLNVLAVINKREQIINKINDLNPHLIIISKTLKGRIPFEKLLLQIKTNYENVKIVFLYGNEDVESRAFLDFLVNNRIYNFIVGSIDEKILDDTIFNDKSEEDVAEYKIPIELNNTNADIIKLKELEEKTQSAISKPITATETIYIKEHIGSFKIAVCSLFERAGSTHLSLGLAKFFADKGIDTAVVTDLKIYAKLKSYYNYDDENLRIKNISIYTKNSNSAISANNTIIIYDNGLINSSFDTNKYNNILMINPISAWEQDTVFEYIEENPILSKSINWLMYPATSDFENIAQNMETIGCIAMKKDYNKEWYNLTDKDNALFNKMFSDLISISKNKRRKW